MKYPPVKKKNYTPIKLIAEPRANKETIYMFVGIVEFALAAVLLSIILV
jgi:glucose uptake protein GlcU